MEWGSDSQARLCQFSEHAGRSRKVQGKDFTPQMVGTWRIGSWLVLLTVLLIRIACSG